MRKSLLHYEIKEKLGEGGMGFVYLARDTRLNRNIALKFLPRHFAIDSTEKTRFRQEAQAAAVLNHPNIAQVYAIEECNEELFIAMEYVEGEELQHAVEQGKLTQDKKQDIALQIAEGISAAHDKGIIHRDIKSGNIMIDPKGRVKIMDFGLARIAGTPHITKAGAAVGTTTYMSPEQLVGQEADVRSDIWAYGVVLYELFTGELPFKGAYEPAIMYAIAEEEPEPVAEVSSDVPPEIAVVIERCLKKDREARYQNFDEIIDDLNSENLPQTRVRKSGGKTGAGVGSIPVYSYIAIPIVLLLLLLIFSPIGSGWLGSSKLPAEQGIAILPFNNIGDNIDVISDGLLETLTGKLAQVDNYRGTLWVIPASEVIQGNVNTPSEAKKEFSVNLAITGSIQQIEERLRFTMNLVDTKTLRQLRSREVESNKDSLASLQARAGGILLEMLNIELKPEIDKALALNNPEQPLASNYYLQGRGYLLRFEKEDNLDKAVEAFQKSIEEDPGHAIAYAVLGESYWRKYQLTDQIDYIDKAKDVLKKAMKIDSELVPVISTLGLINGGTGAYAEAVKNFQKVVTLEPNNYMAFRELARNYEQQGELDKAEENYKIAIYLKSDYWVGYNDLGIFYYQYRGQIDKAIEQFEEVVRLAPENFIGYTQLGAMHQIKGYFKEAAELLKKSLDIKKTFFAANNLGYLNYQIKNYHEAIRFFSVAHELNENSYAVLGNLASAHKELGNTDLAKEYYLKAIQLAENQLQVNPNGVLIINDLGTYYADIGETEQALKYINRSLELDSNNVEVLYRSGFAYERMGNREKALEWIGKAVEMGYPLSDVRNQPELKDLVADERFKKKIVSIAEQ